MAFLDILVQYQSVLESPHGTIGLMAKLFVSAISEWVLFRSHRRPLPFGKVQSECAGPSSVPVPNDAQEHAQCCAQDG